MASILRQGAAVTATILETAAGLLRSLAATDTDTGTETEKTPTPEPQAAADEPVPSGKRLAPATRTRISNPKAARKVRARQG